MPIIWGATCGGPQGNICVDAPENYGCEALGNNCMKHYRADLTDSGDREKELAHLYTTGQICRLE